MVILYSFYTSKRGQFVKRRTIVFMYSLIYPHSILKKSVNGSHSPTLTRVVCTSEKRGMFAAARGSARWRHIHFHIASATSLTRQGSPLYDAELNLLLSFVMKTNDCENINQRSSVILFACDLRICGPSARIRITESRVLPSDGASGSRGNRSANADMRPRQLTSSAERIWDSFTRWRRWELDILLASRRVHERCVASKTRSLPSLPASASVMKLAYFISGCLLLIFETRLI